MPPNDGQTGEHNSSFTMVYGTYNYEYSIHLGELH